MAYLQIGARPSALTAGAWRKKKKGGARSAVVRGVVDVHLQVVEQAVHLVLRRLVKVDLYMAEIVMAEIVMAVYSYGRI